jgi:hypothetical protein
MFTARKSNLHAKGGKKEEKRMDKKLSDKELDEFGEWFFDNRGPLGCPDDLWLQAIFKAFPKVQWPPQGKKEDEVDDIRKEG